MLSALIVDIFRYCFYFVVNNASSSLRTTSSTLKSPVLDSCYIYTGADNLWFCIFFCIFFVVVVTLLCYA